MYSKDSLDDFELRTKHRSDSRNLIKKKKYYKGNKETKGKKKKKGFFSKAFGAK